MSTLFDTEPRAELSTCGQYRYVLRRRWGIGGRPVLFVALNPSTADAEQDDNTVRRMMRFAEVWGWPAMELVNLYAYRATDPRALVNADDPVGPENNRTIAAAAERAAIVIACWGSMEVPRFRDRADVVHGMLLRADATIRCLGVNKDGAPKHPLYVPGTTLPTRWGAVDRG